jgi:hypothetical protein
VTAQRGAADALPRELRLGRLDGKVEVFDHGIVNQLTTRVQGGTRAASYLRTGRNLGTAWTVLCGQNIRMLYSARSYEPALIIISS